MKNIRDERFDALVRHLDHYLNRLPPEQQTTESAQLLRDARNALTELLKKLP